MDIDESRLVTMPGVTVSKLGFSSHDEKTQIKALLWAPEKKDTSPKAIIQISHGMEEYAARYADFANYLCAQGFVVCAADMLGHGNSVTSDEKLSCIPVKGGKDILVEDAHQLRTLVASRYSQQTPYIMFGHSMGSFLTRVYIARHGEGLAGAVLCGSGLQPKIVSWAGNKFARFLANSKGEDHKSPFLDNMGVGAYAKKVPNAKTEFDWLAADESIVQAYIDDPYCGIPFSVGSYATLTDLTAEVANAASAARIPKDLPVFFIAGDQDPIGENGKGVDASADLLRRAGVKHVNVKLYPGMRHEILNEPGKQEVYKDVVAWIDGVIKE